jgi:enediyne biosynthesis protein E4
MKHKRMSGPFLASALLGAVGVVTLTGGSCKNTGTTSSAQPPPAPAAPVSVQFDDVSQKAGIQFRHNNGAFGLLLMPEIMGGGAAWIDYDSDGYQDLFFVNSRDWTDAEIAQFAAGPTGKKYPQLLKNKAQRKRSTSMLYRNNGDGTFKDVTKQAALDFETYGQGVCVSDYDNDGRPDLYVTALDRNFLFHNENGRKFKEVAQPMGVSSSGWSTSAAWVDYDKDGKLDLFVCRYVTWTPDKDIYCTTNGQTKDYCTPDSYPGETCRLYRNEGSKFRDVTEKTGIAKMATGRTLQGKALGVATTDFNADGWPDIVVANDTEPNYLFENMKGERFQEVGQEAGIALNESGQARAAMGVAFCDLNRTGRESLIFGNFSNQMLSLYENQGNRLFIDMAAQCGVGEPSLKFLAFGTIFTDFDNDGWQDIFVATGHVVKDIEEVQRDVTFKERPLVFRNLGRQPGRKDISFEEIGLKSGPALATRVVGRGVAEADYDLDGAVDLVLTTNGDKATLFRNATKTKNGAVRLTLEGTKSNRSAIGAAVEVSAGSEKVRYTVHSGSSYCSQGELPITAGLGSSAKADTITIRWPSGAVTELKDIAAGQALVVNEDRGIVKQAAFGQKQ